MIKLQDDNTNISVCKLKIYFNERFYLYYSFDVYLKQRNNISYDKRY